MRSFIPPRWTYGPEPGCIGADGRSVIYNSNGRPFDRFNFSVKTHSSVHVAPDSGSYFPYSKYNYLGQTRRYDAATALAPDGVTLYEDTVLGDCFKLHATAYAPLTNMFIDVAGNATTRSVQAYFHGGAANPLAPPGAEINWDVWVGLSKAVPTAPAYEVSWAHDCVPAFEVYIGKQRIYGYTSTGYHPLNNIWYCLGGLGRIISGSPSTGPII